MPVLATFAADISPSMGDLLDLLDALFTDGEIVEGDTVFYAAEVSTVSGIVDVDVFGNGFRYSGSGANTFVSRGTIEDLDIYDEFGLAIVIEDFALSVPALNTAIDDDITNPAALERFLMARGWDVLLSDENDVANRFTRVGADDVLFNLTGNDTLDGAGGNDDLFGGNGNDLLFGDIGNDTLEGGNGHDTLLGESGSDTLLGGAGEDSLDGGTAGDSLRGGDRDDTLLGRDGSDRLFGDAGNDRADGGARNDTIGGGAGNDLLLGGAGNDRISGDSGNDRIIGGRGSDLVTGGSGADRFEVTGVSAFERITDFEIGTDLVVVRGTGEVFADIAFADFAYGALATGDGWQIRFDGIASASLDPVDFLFV